MPALQNRVGVLPAANERTRVPQMRSRVESELYRSTETKGEETVNTTDQCWIDLVRSTKQLWNWVGEQKDKQYQIAINYGFGEAANCAQAKQIAYSNVRLYMRKFFSGLIDFNNIGE